MTDATAKPLATVKPPLLRAQSLLAVELKAVEQQLQRITSSAVELVPEVARHLIDAGGKRIRPTLLLLVCRLAEGQAARGVGLATATELFHNASLLHDDVVDRGHFRRGVTAAPRLYGNSAAVLVGDFLMARALGLVVQHGDQRLLAHLCTTITAMAEGEVLQLIRSGRTTLNLPNYEQVIAGKTAGLFSWCCRAGASLGNVDSERIEAAARLGRYFGMAFQVTDDVLDYLSGPETSGKDLANDLEQGKMTLPLLLACEQDEALFAEVERLAAGPADGANYLVIVDRVRRSGALERSLELAASYCQAVDRELASFRNSEEATIISSLAHQLISRVS